MYANFRALNSVAKVVTPGLINNIKKQVAIPTSQTKIKTTLFQKGRGIKIWIVTRGRRLLKRV